MKKRYKDANSFQNIHKGQFSLYIFKDYDEKMVELDKKREEIENKELEFNQYVKRYDKLIKVKYIFKYD